MSAAAPLPPAPRGFAIRLRRPRWIGVAAGVLVVMVVGLRFGLPIYQRRLAMSDVSD